MASPAGASFAATHGMGHGVHSHASHMGSTSAVPVSAGLSDADVLMVKVSDLSDSGPALDTDHA